MSFPGLKINNASLIKNQTIDQGRNNQVGGYIGFTYQLPNQNRQNGQVQLVKLENGSGQKLGIQTLGATHEIPEYISTTIRIIKLSNGNEYINEGDRKKIINWLIDEQKKGSIKKFYPIKKENFKKSIDKPPSNKTQRPKKNLVVDSFLSARRAIYSTGNNLSKVASSTFDQGKKALKNSTVDLAAGVRRRQPIDLLEGATFVKDARGTTYTLNNGVTVPPVSRGAFDAAVANLPPELRKAANGYLFENLKQNPYVPVIAAEMQSGKLMLSGKQFDSDGYLLNRLMPMLAEGFQTSASSPSGWINGFIYSMATLREPLIKGDLKTATSGTASSFKMNELDLSNKQVITQRLLGAPSKILGAVYLEGMSSFESNDRGPQNPQTKRFPRTSGVVFYNALGRIPQVAIGTEETPTMFAKAIHDMPDKRHFSPQMQNYSSQVISHLGKVQSEEKNLLSDLAVLSQKHTPAIGQTFFSNTLTSLERLGLGKQLDSKAVTLVPGTMLAVYASHHERQGYPLAESYRRARNDVARFYQNNEARLSPAELSKRFLKDNLWNDKTWSLLADQHPEMSNDINKIRDRIKTLNSLYGAGVNLNLKIHDQMIIDDLDISTKSLTYLGPSTVAHAEKLVDQAFQPSPSEKVDPNYQKFRQSLAMYLREAAPSHHIEGDPNNINRAGYENTAVPNLMAPSGSIGPMLRSLRSLYMAMKNQGDIKGWHFETMQKVVLYGAMASAGVDPSSMASELRAVEPLVRKYQNQVKQVVGARGYEDNGVLFGLLVNDKLIPGFKDWRVPRIDSKKQRQNIKSLSSLNEAKVPDLDLKDLFFPKSHIPALTNGLIAEGDPKFLVVDGRVDMQLTLNGQLQVFKGVNRAIPEFFVPALMDTVSLQGQPQVVADRLNDAVRLTHAMMGGTIIPSKLGQ